MTSSKNIKTIVLDAGPILKNDPTVATLIAKSESLVTIPAVITEIRDHDARSRVETMLKPFITIRSPRPQNLQFVTNFAKKTGDFSVLSKTDLEVIALTYEVECEHDDGKLRLRSAPGQKYHNGATSQVSSAPDKQQSQEIMKVMKSVTAEGPSSNATAMSSSVIARPLNDGHSGIDISQHHPNVEEASGMIQDLHITDGEPYTNVIPELPPWRIDEKTAAKATEHDSGASDSDGWITPSNLKNHQDKDGEASSSPISQNSSMQVGCITTDFAMQNVLLQIGLNLLSPSLQRIRNIRTYILRCHACFQNVRDTSKQFCPRCGKPTLTRVSCSTNQKGEFRIHLKKNMQWNHRGDRYSIPKPVPGSANGKLGQGRGGGKGGWGQELILTEDQKEYQRAVNGRNQRRAKDLMDEDYLPGILTGDRGRAGGRPKVGAGKNVNAKKRVK